MSADVLGGGVAANTMHTYREPPSERRRRLKNSALLVAAVVIASGATVVVSAAHGTPGWQLARDIGATAAFVVVGAYLFRRHTNGVCTEIRLSDDGVCEFEMPRRVDRVHVAEIHGVKCEVDDDGGGRRYVVRHKHGKVIVLGTLAGFDDFVVQLKRLNPNVNIPEQRTALSLAGEAFFVVSVLAMIALIAIRTLGG